MSNAELYLQLNELVSEANLKAEDITHTFAVATKSYLARLTGILGAYEGADKDTLVIVLDLVKQYHAFTLAVWRRKTDILEDMENGL